MGDFRPHSPEWIFFLKKQYLLSLLRVFKELSYLEEEDLFLNLIFIIIFQNREFLYRPLPNAASKLPELGSRILPLTYLLNLTRLHFFELKIVTNNLYIVYIYILTLENPVLLLSVPLKSRAIVEGCFRFGFVVGDRS